jgi:hypothetical protein
MTEYGIKEKMFTITLDNAANNKTACDLLQESGKSDMLFKKHVFPLPSHFSIAPMLYRTLAHSCINIVHGPWSFGKAAMPTNICALLSLARGTTTSSDLTPIHG